MVHYDYYTGEPISGSPEYLSQYENIGTNIPTQSFGYNQQPMVNPPQGFSYDPNLRFNSMEPNMGYQPTDFNTGWNYNRPQQPQAVGNPAFQLINSNPALQQQYQQQQQDQVVHVDGFRPDNSVYLYPADIADQLEQLEQDMYVELIEEQEELQSRYQGYFNNNPGYNYYGMSYLGGYYGGGNVQRKYQQKLEEIQQQAIERRNKLNKTFSRICHNVVGDDITDEQIDQIYAGYSYTIPARNVQEQSKIDYFSKMQPCSNAGYYQQQELNYRKLHEKYISPDATVEEFSEQANDLLREYELEEERHRRRNGSQYFQEDGYRRVLRNSIIRRKREKQGLSAEQVQGQNPYFNQQVNNMNDLFPILDGWNITDDGTLSIRAPEFEAKDNVFKQEALNNMQNVYEENRQRFLASIYNI